ncbi:hypothetical protein PSYJYH_000027 [Bacillus phage PSYJ-YH]|nr:hypothetical protein PSYJYH_000027 [Bacillus phage PSYJ-YH]
MISATELKENSYLKSNVDYKQLSIYDFLEEDNFLQDGESQEVAPSETLPQVDEAQEVKAPSSALDTEKLISENLVFNPEGYAEKVVELPTEDTDKTCDGCHGKPLFSVGDTVKIINPYSEDDEDYAYIQTVEGSHRVITSGVHITIGGKKYFNTVDHGNLSVPSDELPFYIQELQKI